MKTVDAIKLADEAGFDLVCVAPQAKVPVCRYMDFKKYIFTLNKRGKDSRKNQKITVVKEIRVSPVIGGNDFTTKVKNCREFLPLGKNK